MVELAVLPKDHSRRITREQKVLFAHVFAGPDRVFGYGGQIRLAQRRKIVLHHMAVSCSSLCLGNRYRKFASALLSSLRAHGWRASQRWDGARSYRRGSCTITLVRTPQRLGVTMVHVILDFGRVEKRTYRKLFRNVTSQLSYLNRNGDATDDLARRPCGIRPISRPEHLTVEMVSRRLSGKRLVAYTGAGLSQASGILTFEGSDSLEERLKLIEDFPGMAVDWMVDRPTDLANVLGAFEASFLTALPNVAHRALANLEREGVLHGVITSNFDDLHESAGSRNVCRCTAGNTAIWSPDHRVPSGALIVIGVSEDEQRVIETFRSAGWRVITVNPTTPPYLCDRDWLIQDTAERALPELANSLRSRRPQFDFNSLLQYVRRRSPNSNSTLHGECHWRTVAWFGHRLASEVFHCDRAVVLLFALLHDCTRLHDGNDPDHGRRAANLIGALDGKFFQLSRDQSRLLEHACLAHAHGYIADDPTVSVCWDADRLDLWRCRITPDPAFLSTCAAKDPAMIQCSKTLRRKDLTWSDIASLYGLR
jgi:uncharacterized protein